LFFDLVYVFAVTQLSRYLLGHSDPRGAPQAGLLLVMVWLIWSYTTWVTNWLDPELMAVPVPRGADADQPGHVGVPAAGVRGPGTVGRRRGVRGPADRPYRVHGHRAARASAGGQFPAHPGLVRGQQRV
jgi:Bacterial low temperature requirement A protein (LtrA)